MARDMIRMYRVLFLVVISLAFLLIGLHKVNEAIDPAYEDTAGYLEQALFLNENGGILNFLHLCFTGQYKTAVQHPLYPLLLSPFASRDLSFFHHAKLVSLVIGLAVLIAFFFITKDLHGDIVAYLGSTLLIFNALFLQMSSHVACEGLLVLFALLSFYFMVKGLEDAKYCMWCGITSGLAYMTKGTGLLLIPIFIIALVWILKIRVLTRPHFWIFFLFFFISSSPLIIRNHTVYSTPLYEGHNSNAPWLDSWEEMGDPKYEIILDWGTGTYSTKALPTMRSYMQTHSIAELVERAVRGIKGESGLILSSMSMEVGSKVERYFIGLTVLFFVLGVIGDQNRRRIVIPIATLVIFFLPFAWYFQVIPSSRFIAPLVPILCMYTGFGLIITLKYFDQSVIAGRGKVSLAKWVPAVLTVFLVLIAGYILKTNNANLASEPIRLSEDQEELFSWMRDNVKEDDVVFMTPTYRYWALLWVKGFKGKLVVSNFINRAPSKYAVKSLNPGSFGSVTRSHPTVNNLGLSEESMATLDEFLKKRNVSIVILHQQNYSSLEPVIEYVVYNDSDGLIEKRAITGWKLAYKHSEKPTKFLIYQLDTT